jgi:phage terminase large subunit
MKLKLVLSEKQNECLQYWIDNTTEEILYGGAKGGGKSYLMASLIFGDALIYPDTFYFIARSQLTDLRKYTIPSIHEVFKVQFKIDITKYSKYNGQDNYYELYNGSRVYLLACDYIPSDPMFERFGSMQMTRGAIEEGGEIHYLAKQNLKVSLGRKNNDKYNLKAKLLIVGNPKKNWMKFDFVEKFKNNNLPDNKKYIQSFYTDNPFRQSGYDAILSSITDKTAKERLLYGNWDYGDDDPALLCNYDAILDLFTNDHVQPTNNKYISADLAMQGRDRFIVGSWDGLICRVAIDKPKATGKSIEEDLKELMINDGVPHSCTVVDSDGLGAYLDSYLLNIKTFHGGKVSTTKFNDGKKINEYDNLKAECGYKLAEYVNEHKIKIICSEAQKQAIIEELSILKKDKIDNDTGKLAIIKKDKMKEFLQRSPDYLDMLLMRMYFEVKKSFGF